MRDVINLGLSRSLFHSLRDRRARLWPCD
jgi:hypothetical protein